MKAFRARLDAAEAGTEAWALVVPQGDNLFFVEHALKLMPPSRLAEVRAVHAVAGLTMSTGRARQAVVDAAGARALWDDNCLSLADSYGTTRAWRWRLRGAGSGPALTPGFFDCLADAKIVFPAVQLSVEGELRLEGGWQPLRGQAVMVHRASLEGCRSWLWLVLPRLDSGAALVASLVGLPGLALKALQGWLRWQDRELSWPAGLAMFSCRFSRAGLSWQLKSKLEGKELEVTLHEIDRLELERGLSGAISLIYVQAEVRFGAERKAGRGILEAFEAEEDASLSF